MFPFGTQSLDELLARASERPRARGQGPRLVLEALIADVALAQAGPEACKEYVHVLVSLQSALYWLELRTARRQRQGVAEGGAHESVDP